MNNDKDILEFGLLRIKNVVRNNIILIISICLFCGAVGFSLAQFVLEKKYEATTKIIIVQNDVDALDSINNYKAILKLNTTYKQIIMSETVTDEVIKNLDLVNERDIDTDNFDELVKVNIKDNTEVMTISVETTNPKLSAKIANEIVDVFTKKIHTIYDIKNVSILDRAKVPEKKSAPSNIKYTAFGTCVGILISIFMVITKLSIDTKIKTEEEVKEIFDYPIIGLIPDFDVEDGQDNLGEGE